MLGQCACIGGMCGACGVQDLGSTMPQLVSGSTAGQTDSMTAPCGSYGGYDRSFIFTAPYTGSYTIDTCGSSFDTVLYVYSSTCGLLQCDDDSCYSGYLESELYISLTQGQQVLIVVDGYSDYDYGSFMLSIQ